MAMRAFAPSMAVPPRGSTARGPARRGLLPGRGSASISQLRVGLHADGDQLVPLPLEADARQWPRRGPLQHRPAGGREVALMAGTLEPIALARVDHRAREVRALLQIGRASCRERV